MLVGCTFSWKQNILYLISISGHEDLSFFNSPILILKETKNNLVAEYVKILYVQHFTIFLLPFSAERKIKQQLTGCGRAWTTQDGTPLPSSIAPAVWRHLVDFTSPLSQCGSFSTSNQ